MSEQQREKNIKQLTNFSKTTLKNKLHLAIEKIDTTTIDEILLSAQENNFDLINHINTNGNNYHTTIDSILKAYVKILNDKEKEFKKSFNFFSKDKKADFSFLDSLIERGLNFKAVNINDNKDVFDVLFRFDFDKIPLEMRVQFKNNLVSRMPVEDMSLSRYINLVKSYRFFRTPKGKNRYEDHNISLFNEFISQHINKNIPLKVNEKDLEDLFSLIRSYNYVIKKNDIKGILDLFPRETLIAENNFEYVFRLLMETEDNNYILDFLSKHKINFNEEMNNKYKVSRYSASLPDLPLMAKLIIQPNSKNIGYVYEDPLLKSLSDHFDFKYKNTAFSSVFKEEYYMSNYSNYYSNQSEVLERMIDKGMDFYSEDLNSGTNIFDYAFTHSSSRFFMTYLFEKNKLNIDYINQKNKTLIDTLIVSNEISYLQKGQRHNRENDISSSYYFFELLNKKYENSFIPDVFFNDAFKHSKSKYAKTVISALNSKVRPDFKNSDGYNFNTLSAMFSSENNFSYFDESDLNNSFTSQESSRKEQNFLHVLFQNKESNNILRILNKTMELGSLAWLQKDKDGHNPFYYLNRSSYVFGYSSDNDFEHFFDVANKIPAELFLFQKNFKDIPLTDILPSYFSFSSEEKIKYTTIIEKKKLEFSLNIDSSEIDSNISNKKRL